MSYFYLIVITSRAPILVCDGRVIVCHGRELRKTTLHSNSSIYKKALLLQLILHRTFRRARPTVTAVIASFFQDASYRCYNLCTDNVESNADRLPWC